MCATKSKTIIAEYVREAWLKGSHSFRCRRAVSRRRRETQIQTKINWNTRQMFPRQIIRNGKSTRSILERRVPVSISRITCRAGERAPHYSLGCRFRSLRTYFRVFQFYLSAMQCRWLHNDSELPFLLRCIKWLRSACWQLAATIHYRILYAIFHRLGCVFFSRLFVSVLFFVEPHTERIDRLQIFLYSKFVSFLRLLSLCAPFVFGFHGATSATL